MCANRSHRPLARTPRRKNESRQRRDQKAPVAALGLDQIALEGSAGAATLIERRRVSHRRSWVTGYGLNPKTKLGTQSVIPAEASVVGRLCHYLVRNVKPRYRWRIVVRRT